MPIYSGLKDVVPTVTLYGDKDKNMKVRFKIKDH